MFNRLPILKLTSILFLAIIVSGCTQSQSTVETTLAPQAAQQSSTETVEANALSEPSQTSPAQTVTETQTSTDVANNTTSGSQVAALDPGNALTFLPIEGAPTNAVTKLSNFIKRSAASKGLSVYPPTQTGAEYQVKGYFSALNDGSGTLVVYVWDVLDRSGKRLHRINGQERSGSSKPNPWLAITDVELSQVADRTTASLKSWVDNRKS